jgi:hypothetical protein
LQNLENPLWPPLPVGAYSLADVIAGDLDHRLAL